MKEGKKCKYMHNGESLRKEDAIQNIASLFL